MKIGLVTTAYNQPEGVAALLASARSARHRLAVHLFLHSRHPATAARCQQLAADYCLTYYPYGVNRGVSRSWNEGLLDAYAAGADVVLIANDDITFADGDIDRLAERADRYRDRYIVTAAGFHRRFNRRIVSHGYACFAINPIALATLGCFDENFFPAYCEDQDYAYRARLAGLAEENCPDTMIEHGGSSAIFADAELRLQNGLTHQRNIDYYRRKWGGDGEHEVFRRPFNDPAFDHHVAPQRRQAPYGPGYDRTDRDIVRR